MNTGLRDQVVLVTGASGGIGAATARALASEGARLVLHYHSNADAVESLRRALPAESIAEPADLRSESDVERLFDRAIERFGEVNSLVVNAGIWPPDEKPIHEMSLDVWRNTIEINLTGAFLLCRAFFQHLRSRPRERASVVLVGSTAALFGEAGHADYAASKAGLVYGLTRSLKNEIVRLSGGGRVNAICPGWTVTPMTEDQLENRVLVDRVLSTMSLRKVATADDIARAIVFLLSDELSGHITGAILPIAGGMEGRRLWDR